MPVDLNEIETDLEALGTEADVLETRVRKLRRSKAEGLENSELEKLDQEAANLNLEATNLMESCKRIMGKLDAARSGKA